MAAWLYPRGSYALQNNDREAVERADLMNHPLLLRVAMG